MTQAPLDVLEALVQRTTQRAGPLRATEMPGGASTREFYRVELGDGRTAVAMFVPDASRSEEISKVSEAARRWPFLEVRDLLAQAGVRVPRLLGDASEQGFILVEDLGDDTLAAYLARAPERKAAVYRVAVTDLADAQNALARLPDESIVTERAFDFDLLRWELDHFREWGLEARGLQPSPEDRARFDRVADAIATEIASWPRGFVHRDYQSRNIMVVGESGAERLVWIDFQDALLGPRVYDLVALLNDSYQSFDRTFVDARLDEYAERRGLSGERQEIGRQFDVVTVQRKLKDAGRFVYIDRVKGDPSYLQFIEPTLGKVQGALERLSGDADFRWLRDRVRVWRRWAPGAAVDGSRS